MSESRGLEPVFMAVLYVALGAVGSWIYRDRLDAEEKVAAKDQTITTIQSAAELLRTQLPNVTRTIDKLGAIQLEYKNNVELVKSLANCVVPDDLVRLSDESMAEINRNAAPANSSTPRKD